MLFLCFEIKQWTDDVCLRASKLTQLRPMVSSGRPFVISKTQISFMCRL
jgi:hypothetical protein